MSEFDSKVSSDDSKTQQLHHSKDDFKQESKQKKLDKGLDKDKDKEKDSGNDSSNKKKQLLGGQHDLDAHQDLKAKDKDLKSKDSTASGSDMPVDSGSSLVGGVSQTLSSALNSVSSMLPSSLTSKAATLSNSLQEKAVDLIHNIGVGTGTEEEGKVESSKDDIKKKEGIDKKKKDLGGKDDISKDKDVGSGDTKQHKKQKAANISSDNLKQQVVEGAQQVKAMVTEKSKELKSKIPSSSSSSKASTDSTSSTSGASPSLMQKASEATTTLLHQATALKDSVLAKAGVAGETIAKNIEGQNVSAKKKHKRRRGGRAHGNRRMKMREVDVPAVESIADTLGEKAKELKEVVVEELPNNSSATSGGIISSIKTTASGLMESVTSSVSHTLSGLTGSATGADSSSEIKSKKAVNSKPKTGRIDDHKPVLERKNELPALGTPNSPALVQDSKGRLGVDPGDRSSLLDKASFMKDQIVGTIGEGIEKLTENADDSSSSTSSVSSTKEKLVAKAADTVRDLKARVNEKVNLSSASDDSKQGKGHKQNQEKKQQEQSI